MTRRSQTNGRAWRYVKLGDVGPFDNSLLQIIVINSVLRRATNGARLWGLWPMLGKGQQSILCYVLRAMGWAGA